MKLLLADSGSTKTSWLLTEGSQLIKQFTTAGYNPFYYPVSELQKLVRERVLSESGSFMPDKIVYYGSGCSTPHNCGMVSSVFHQYYPGTPVEVYADMLGSAHCSLGNKPGIACILGTGSNVCVYDGNQITYQLPSLGYFFADEGSGAYIGRLFLKSYLYGELPLLISEKFNHNGHFTREYILNKVYRSEKPSKFLAEVVLFIGENMHEPFCKQLIIQAFDDFIANYIVRIPGYYHYKIGFTGAVAWYFQDVMKERLALHGLHEIHFVKNLDQALAAYYGVYC